MGEDISDELGDEVGFDVRWNGCTIETGRLYDIFHREYRVSFEDVAGNRIGPFEVRTGRNTLGCGGPSREENERVFPPMSGDADSGHKPCASAGAAPFGPPAALLLLVVRWSRRRSTEVRPRVG